MGGDDDDIKSARSRGGQSSRSRRKSEEEQGSAQESGSGSKRSGEKKSRRSSRRSREDEEPDSGAKLINFGGLAEILKDLINRVEDCEIRLDEIPAMFVDQKAVIDQKATKDDIKNVLEEGKRSNDTFIKRAESNEAKHTQLETKVDNLKKDVALFDQSVKKMVNQKNTASDLVSKIEAKIANLAMAEDVAKLHMQMGEYATKDDTNQVEQKLSAFALKDDFDRMERVVTELLPKIRSASAASGQVDAKINAVQSKIFEETATLVKRDVFDVTIQSLHGEIVESRKHTDDLGKRSEVRHEECMGKISSVYQDLNEDLQGRARRDDIIQIRSEMNLYALEKDTDAFKEATIPKMKFCVEMTQAFHERLNAQDLAIQRVDEALIDKAPKYDVVLANSRIELSMNKERCMKEFQKLYERLDLTNKRLEMCVESMQDQSQRVSSNAAGAGNNDEIMYEMSRKADAADVMDLTRIKASNYEVDRTSKELLLLTLQMEFLVQAVQQNGQIDMLRSWISDGILPPNVEAMFPGRKIPDVNEIPTRFKEEITLAERLEQKFNLSNSKPQKRK